MKIKNLVTIPLIKLFFVATPVSTALLSSCNLSMNSNNANPEKLKTTLENAKKELNNITFGERNLHQKLSKHELINHFYESHTKIHESINALKQKMINYIPDDFYSSTLKRDIEQQNLFITHTATILTEIDIILNNINTFIKEIVKQQNTNDSSFNYDLDRYKYLIVTIYRHTLVPGINKFKSITLKVQSEFEAYKEEDCIDEFIQLFHKQASETLSEKIQGKNENPNMSANKKNKNKHNDQAVEPSQTEIPKTEVPKIELDQTIVDESEYNDTILSLTIPYSHSNLKEENPHIVNLTTQNANDSSVSSSGNKSTHSAPTPTIQKQDVRRQPGTGTPTKPRIKKSSLASFQSERAKRQKIISSQKSQSQGSNISKNDIVKMLHKINPNGIKESKDIMKLINELNAFCIEASIDINFYSQNIPTKKTEKFAFNLQESATRSKCVFGGHYVHGTNSRYTIESQVADFFMDCLDKYYSMQEEEHDHNKQNETESEEIDYAAELENLLHDASTKYTLSQEGIRNLYTVYDNCDRDSADELLKKYGFLNIHAVARALKKGE